MPLHFQKCHQEPRYAHTSWHREVKVGFCSTFVRDWRPPLLASARRADITQTEVASVQVSGASEQVIWGFHESRSYWNQKGARLYPFLHVNLSALLIIPRHAGLLVTLSYPVARTWPWKAVSIPVCPLWPAAEKQAPIPGRAALLCADLHRTSVLGCSCSSLHCISVWDALSVEELSREPPRFSIF